ncbi:recombinase family protein [Verrucomicrobiota bacterium]
MKSTENKGRFVAYYRVSTESQGRSGLGLEAQKKAVLDYLDGGRWELLEEFTEVESGKKAARPELEKALKLCKKRRATLVIAKLDRLARNVHFISGLMERGVKFCAVEFPNADRFMLHVHAAMSEQERVLISARTKAGLERAKARGVKLGRHGAVLARQNAAKAKARARELKPVVAEIRKAGKVTVRAIMEELNRRGINTPRGRTWHPQTVNVLLRRIDGKAGQAK